MRDSVPTSAGPSVEADALNAWFCREVLPLEPALLRFIRRHWRNAADVSDLRQEIYERVLRAASREYPAQVPHYVFTIARNHMINRARRARIIRFDLVADLESVAIEADFATPERQLSAREELQKVQTGLERLPPRCREVIELRKIEGLSTREVAARLRVGINTVEQQTTHGMRALVDFMLGGTGRIKRPAGKPRLGRERGA